MKRSSRFVLSVGFSLMLLLLVLIIGTGLRNMHQIKGRMDDIVNVSNVKSTHIANLRSIARERSLLIYHMIIARDPFVVDEDVQKAAQLAGEFVRIRDEFSELSTSAAERRRFEEMMRIVARSSALHQQIMEMLQEGKYDFARRILQEQSLGVQSQLLSFYDRILDEQRRATELAAAAAGREYRRSFYLMLALSALTVLFGVFISVYTIRRTSEAENYLRDVNKELEDRVSLRTRDLVQANGDLQRTIRSLNEARDQLVQSEKMASLGGMVAGISHEINTPLGIAVTASSSLFEETRKLRTSFESGAMKRSDLQGFIHHASEVDDILSSNLARAAELIRSFKQIAVDQSRADLRQVDMRKYLDEILLSLQPEYKRRPIEVLNDAQADLICHCQPGALSQIVSNLVLNALIHAFDAQQAGVIRLSARRVGEEIEIRCEDDGKGILPEHIDHVFEPFFTTRRGRGGTGLGLNIVYNLVTSQLRGRISVQSEPGRGTAFTIWLPADEPAAGAERSLPTA